MKKIAFTGHRPSTLGGGYSWNSVINRNIMKNLAKIISVEISENDFKSFIFGGALGIDQMAFDVVLKLIHQFDLLYMEIAVPFKTQAHKWNVEDKVRYNSQIVLADKVTYVDTLQQYKIDNVDEGIYHPAKLTIRNNYMVDNCDKLIAIWNGDYKSGTGNCVKYAEKMGKEILIVKLDDIKC